MYLETHRNGELKEKINAAIDALRHCTLCPRAFRNYPDAARQAVLEMHRQVGDFIIDRFGIARRGLLIRHLVMPNDMAGTRDIMRFLARKVSLKTYVNIMAQYRPCGQTYAIPGLASRPTEENFEAAFQAAKEEGITRFNKPMPVFKLW